MTSFFGYNLQDNDGRLIRNLVARITELEKQSARDVPIGTVVAYHPPCRSPQWSVSRQESMSSLWNRWYKLNDFNSGGKAADASQDPTLAGTLMASVAGSIPIQGQPGGLTSEGGYSIYFPATNSSRIEVPRALSQQRGWTMEAIFRPEVVPQDAFILYNGSYGSSNGYGMRIGNSAGTASGSKLLYRTPGETIDTGITLVAGQWYHAIFVAQAGDNTLHWYVSTITPLTKIFSIVSGSAAQATPTMPTGLTVIGARDGGNNPFKGWVDEISTHTSEVASNSTQYSVQDRIRSSLEPGAPQGWVKPDGTAVSRVKYAPLFQILGESEGAGDGATTFNLPRIEGHPGALLRV